MNTLIRAATKPRRLFVRLAPFEFESFEVRMRRITRHKSLPIGVSFRRMNIPRAPRQFKTIAGPVDAAQPAKIFLPSPSLQGHGLTCSRSLPGNCTLPLLIPSPKRRESPRESPFSLATEIDQQRKIHAHHAYQKDKTRQSTLLVAMVRKD
jgi:hypothetical protein